MTLLDELVRTGNFLAGYYLCLPTLMPSVYIKTYGCQMNERDSEQVARSLLVRGYRLVKDETQADVKG